MLQNTLSLPLGGIKRKVILFLVKLCFRLTKYISGQWLRSLRKPPEAPHGWKSNSAKCEYCALKISLKFRNLLNTDVTKNFSFLDFLVRVSLRTIWADYAMRCRTAAFVLIVSWLMLVCSNNICLIDLTAQI